MLCAAVVRDDCLFVLRLEGVELASEFAQCRLGVAKAEGARLFERAERGGDAGQGGFVWCNVEICYCMGDELGQKSADRNGWKGARWSVTVAGSSSRSMAAVRCIRSFSWNSFDCTINQRSEEYDSTRTTSDV
jgi:hypothetical protein